MTTAKERGFRKNRIAKETDSATFNEKMKMFSYKSIRFKLIYSALLGKWYYIIMGN